MKIYFYRICDFVLLFPILSFPLFWFLIYKNINVVKCVYRQQGGIRLLCRTIKVGHLVWHPNMIYSQFAPVSSRPTNQLISLVNQLKVGMPDVRFLTGQSCFSDASGQKYDAKPDN